MTEISASLGPPHSPSTALSVESTSTLAARAGPAWERVVALIGHFDLDPSRALDVILDVFSANLMTHTSFFLSFLSFSPWTNLRQTSAGPTSEAAVNIQSNSEQYRGKALDEILAIAETQTSPCGISKSKVLAQVLGFKFSHYQV